MLLCCLSGNRVNRKAESNIYSLHTTFLKLTITFNLTPHLSICGHRLHETLSPTQSMILYAWGYHLWNSNKNQWAMMNDYDS